jgi:hypothetical protein
MSAKEEGKTKYFDAQIRQRPSTMLVDLHQGQEEPRPRRSRQKTSTPLRLYIVNGQLKLELDMHKRRRTAEEIWHHRLFVKVVGRLGRVGCDVLGR